MRSFLINNCSFQQNNVYLSKITRKKQAQLFSCDLAFYFEPIFKNHYPEDTVIKKTIQSIEDYIFGLGDRNYICFLRDYIFDNFCDPHYYPFYYTVCYILETNERYNDDYTYIANIIQHIDRKLTPIQSNQWDFIYKLYLQTFKPNHITIPKEPLFVELAKEIRETKDFSLYKILIDAIYDSCNIKIKTPCLGLSNWLLYNLLF